MRTLKNDVHTERLCLSRSDEWGDRGGVETILPDKDIEGGRVVNKPEPVAAAAERMVKSANTCLDCPFFIECDKTQIQSIEDAVVASAHDMRGGTEAERDHYARIRAVPTGVVAGVAYTTNVHLAKRLLADSPESDRDLDDTISLTKFGCRNQMNLYRIPLV